jgi:hypothetical protein
VLGVLGQLWIDRGGYLFFRQCRLTRQWQK